MQGEMIRNYDGKDAHMLMVNALMAKSKLLWTKVSFY